MQGNTSLSELNNLVNLPAIYASTGFPEGKEITLAEFCADPRNVGLTCQYGGMIFHYEGNAVYSGHFLFIPGSPGLGIKRAAAFMLQEMFTKYGARVIKGYPPRENRAVRVIGIALGYRKIKDANFIDELNRPCETYEVKEQWVQS